MKVDIRTSLIYFAAVELKGVGMPFAIDVQNDLYMNSMVIYLFAMFFVA